MKTKYWYALLQRIRLGRAVLLVAAVSLSAIVVASAMRLDLTPSNNPGDSATGPQLNSSNQIVAASTTFIVNDIGDADDASPGNGVCATATGVCTLRAAIREANALPGTDDINFSVTGTIPFGSGGGTYEINDDLSIQPHTGQARNLTIQSIGARVFRVNAGVTLLLTNMTITNGGSGGATLFSFGGGAIWNDRGRVFANNVTFSANYSCTPVPTCLAGRGHGGAIANSGYLEVYNSTFVNNVAPAARWGGAIYNFGGVDDTTGIIYNGSAVIVNSTFVGNSSGGHGGGIANAGGALTVINSTIAGNHADTGGGLDNAVGSSLRLRNTILAYNTAVNPATGNCRIAGSFVDEGGNLSSDASCPFTNPFSKSNTDPILGPLQNNGGRTDTMALQSGSPAIDAGVPPEGDCKDHLDGPLTYDQRYFPRPVDGDGNGKATCDSGAYEAGPGSNDTPTPTPTDTPIPTPTDTPTDTPIPTSTDTPTPIPTDTPTPTNTPMPRIKVTGGGQIPVPDPTSKGEATFGFNADQNEAGSTAATGHLNYVNHDTGLHINGSVNDIQVIATNPDGSPKTVQFSGTCDGNGPACTFIVTVEDHGEPGTEDEFSITVTGELTESQSQRVISKGNIQFHIR
jgi:CSLREA domain-containing protein